MNVLDRNIVETKVDADVPEGPPPPAPRGLRRFIDPLRRAWGYSVSQGFSSLTRRIIFLNVAGLLALVIGILYLSQFRAGLIDARVQSLLVQGDIMAGAIAASATVDSDAITVDPERLLELAPGESYDPSEEASSGLDFPINPERVAPVLRRLVSPTNTRARIYDRDGGLILDSRNLYDVLRFDLPPPSAEKPGFIERAFVALPVQRFMAVRGALMLSTQGPDIDNMVTAERLGNFKVFLVTLSVMLVLSFLLANTIAGPVRRLAGSAEMVRRRTGSRVEIPDFTQRRDEIGHLSGALRDMTDALYSRIEAIESFAADVAHELKNPLTSMRSAVETLPLAKTETSRARLLSVIEHDVRRLDRLISDISDASRLDAELQRRETGAVDLNKLLTTVVNVANEVRKDDGVKVSLRFEGNPRAFVIPGHDSRLGQVVNNLIDNARSFSPPGGSVRVTCRRIKQEIEILVDDDGPGVREEALEKIFERFYTDRPHQGFGQNSGLGLSISKQIVEAHDGRLWVENRLGPPGPDGPPQVLGARFILRLPAM